MAEARNHNLERTVSRYLHGRPTTRSQAWRTSSRTTSAARHLSPVMFADAHDEDIAVDASDLSARPAALIDASCAFIHRTSVDWERSLQPSALGMRFGTNHCQDDTGVHQSSGRDPHGTDGCHQPRGVPLTAFLRLTPV